jgi:HSP20 family protein
MAKQAKDTSSQQSGGLTPWRPFAEMARWERDMERILGAFLGGRRASAEDSETGLLREPSVDLYMENDQVVVKAEMPGMSKDDIQVTLSDNVLTIKGEKKKEEEDKGKDYYRSERIYGASVRSLQLPAEVDPEKIKATFKNGVLEIRLPKTEDAKKKEIKINVQS